MAQVACQLPNKSESEQHQAPLVNILGATQTATISEISTIDSAGSKVETRFACPPGYERVACGPSSFAQHLRELPLKPPGSQVLHYDGSVKPDRGVYHAVVDLPIGRKDLHQCADAVIRLRADYWYAQRAYEQIHFEFTNGFRIDYLKWMEGNRIVVQGNNVSWRKSKAPSNTIADYWSYLETVFTYAGTLSLDRELRPVSIDSLAIGDVFIRGGSPGHAVIVVDMAKHSHTGKVLFILAQSYMPAQEIQILRNPQDPALSPWYELPRSGILVTPEWEFSAHQLKRFD